MIISNAARELSCRVLLVLCAAMSSNALADDVGTPPRGKALICVIQYETRNFAKLTVFIDGRNIGTVRRNTYLTAIVEPGTHTVSSAGIAPSSVSIVAQAGQTHYVVQKINPQGNQEQRVVSADDAKAYLGFSRPINPEAVVVPGRIAPPPAVARKEREQRPVNEKPVTLILKSGLFKASKSSQSWFDTATTLDSSSKSVLDFTGEYEFSNGGSIGGEVLTYKNSWTQADGSAGSLESHIWTVNGKKYFHVNRIVRPFVGGGVGFASASSSGDITGGANGLAYQIMGGVEFRFSTFGVYLELKDVHAATKSKRSGTSTEDTVDVSGRGFFIGASANF
jgi:opacity protein-like surface antigen